ncbi:hypothetical protein HAX54_018950, partial [Datura stramonium]|nr:hypothetical protein [Datura stramonium]
MEKEHNQGPKPFKFMNHITKHLDFMQHVTCICHYTVQGTPMERIWKKFKFMKGSMKGLKIWEFSKVGAKIQTTRQQREAIQSQLGRQYNDQDLYNQEKTLKVELEKWSLVEE